MMSYLLNNVKDKTVFIIKYFSGNSLTESLTKWDIVNFLSTYSFLSNKNNFTQSCNNNIVHKKLDRNHFKWRLQL